ncbi:peptidyl-prolyl cis-trans isomerase [Bacteroidia bacterium]|nr:peptidyl-prolyl cis-trans isomerase [Bacteroidia bacterium]
MKKMCLAIAMIANISLCAAQEQKVRLITDVDSISYAYGVSATQGLDRYLEENGVDKTFLEDFIKGFLEGTKISRNDLKENARFLGLTIGNQVNQMFPRINEELYGNNGTSTLDKSRFLAGFMAAVLGKDLLINTDEANNYVETKRAQITSAANEKFKTKHSAFLEENKKKTGVMTLPSGLQYKVITEGKGPKPTSEDVVKVDYVGTTIEGIEFDSSVKRGEPAQFQLGGLIAGWVEGIQLMPVGSKYIFYIPYNLAYGESGRGEEIEPYATLIFEITLHEIVKETN